MAKLRRLSPRKEPTQKRSLEMREAILQAATYVLKKEGPFKFTTNKVAERAGASIASLYQYYPNKESLLFHLVEIEWAHTSDRIFPILKDTSKSYRDRLHIYIEKFYESEADESTLKEAIGSAGILIEDTKEYKNLVEKADQAFIEFLSGAIKHTSKSDLKNKADFIYHTINSYSEDLPEVPWTHYKRDAKMMAEMICLYFKID